MKKWLLALALVLLPTAASAQCSGVAPANTLCGNLTASPNVPGFFAASGTFTGTVDPHYVPVASTLNNFVDGFYLAPNTGITLLASPSAAGDCINTACDLKTACAYRTQIATFLTGAIGIQLADGTYNSIDVNNALCTVQGNIGNGPVQTDITGNCTTPGNVVLAVPNSDVGFYVVELGEPIINCLTITLGTNSVGIQAVTLSLTEVNKVHFGTATNTSTHVALNTNAVYSITGAGEFIDASAATHWSVASGATLSGGGGTTITTNVSFSSAFLVARGQVYIDLSQWTLTNAHTVSGTAAILIGPGYMSTPGNAACSSALPGGGGCTLSQCFVDSANDLQTDGKCLNSAMPAPTRAGDIVYNNGSGWWQSLAGNNSGIGFFTENPSGTPAWVTPGTGLGVSGNALNSNATVIDTYTTGDVNAVVTGKGGYTLWPRGATVDNLAASSATFTCSGNPTITYYECGTDVSCASPTTIGAITLAASGRAYANSTGLSAISISAGDFTAWALTAGTCSAIDVIGKAQIHMN